MRRGFTLIEVCIVLSMVGFLSIIFLDLCLAEYRLFHKVAALTELRSEAEGTAYRVLRRGRGTIDPDNRGVRFADGSHVRWSAQRLLLDGRPLTRDRVVLFAAVRRAGALELTVELERRKEHYRAVVRR